MAHESLRRAVRGLAGRAGHTAPPCETCGASEAAPYGGILVYARAGDPPTRCPECGRKPACLLPDNGRGDRQAVVQ